jgi:hypothetical protein
LVLYVFDRSLKTTCLDIRKLDASPATAPMAKGISRAPGPNNRKIPENTITLIAEPIDCVTGSRKDSTAHRLREAYVIVRSKPCHADRERKRWNPRRRPARHTKKKGMP